MSNIIKLPVPFKSPDKNIFSIVKEKKCDHFLHGFAIDDEKKTVECRACGAEMSPMSVLLQYAKLEERLNEKVKYCNRRLDVIKKANKKLDERYRTKCNHCGKLTNIRR